MTLINGSHPFYYVNLTLLRVKHGPTSRGGAGGRPGGSGGLSRRGGGRRCPEAYTGLLDLIVGLGHSLLGAAQGVLAVLVG